MECSCLHKHWFLLFTLFSLAVGIVLGFILQYFNAPIEAIVWLSLPGELFLRALRFSVIPLLACNIVTVGSSINPKAQGKLALIALGYCLFMNTISAFIGGGITLAIKPGTRASKIDDSSGVPGEQTQISDVLADLFRNLVPDNIVTVFLSSVFTTYVPLKNNTNASSNDVKRVLSETPGVNILGLLSSSLVIGLSAGSFGKETEIFVNFFQAAAKILTHLLSLVMLLLPIGMASLVLKAIAEIDDLLSTLTSVGFFILSSVAFLSIQAFIVLPIIYVLFVRRNPFRLFFNISRALLTAFSTTSSITALPDVFKACEKENMNMSTAQLMGPFLTSFNANGSAAFIASSLVFCAQFSQIEMGTSTAVIIFLLVGLNVMALPAVPSASIILVLLLLRTFGIPTTAVPLLYIPEFINDRLRTMLNVESHSVCLLILNRFEQKMENTLLLTVDNSSQEVSVGDSLRVEEKVNIL